MGRKKKEVEAVESSPVPQTTITYNFDVDPNDPRVARAKRADRKPLKSLND